MEKVTGPGVPAVQRKAFNIRPYMFQCCAAILATGSIVTYMNVNFSKLLETLFGPMKVAGAQQRRSLFPLYR